MDETANRKYILLLPHHVKLTDKFEIICSALIDSVIKIES
jgi:hypothetical protein